MVLDKMALKVPSNSTILPIWGMSLKITIWKFNFFEGTQELQLITVFKGREGKLEKDCKESNQKRQHKRTAYTPDMETDLNNHFIFKKVEQAGK